MIALVQVLIGYGRLFISIHLNIIEICRMVVSEASAQGSDYCKLEHLVGV